MSSSKLVLDPHPHGPYDLPHQKVSKTDICGSAIELKKDVAIVILGASGDLAKKKTVFPLPAVFSRADFS